jgi:hypothetical protein
MVAFVIGWRKGQFGSIWQPDDTIFCQSGGCDYQEPWDLRLGGKNEDKL